MARVPRAEAHPASVRTWRPCTFTITLFRTIAGAVMTDRFVATYVWPFRISDLTDVRTRERARRSLDDRIGKYLSRQGWDTVNSPFSVSDAYNISAYFPTSVSTLFLGAPLTYLSRSDVERISAPCCPGVNARVLETNLFIMPNQICMLILMVDFIPEPTANKDQIAISDFLRLHSILRRSFPPYYMSRTKPGGIADIVISYKDKDVCYEVRRLPPLDEGEDPVCRSPWLLILDPSHSHYDAVRQQPLTILNLTDNRLPSMLYCALGKGRLADTALLYRSLVGDTQDDILPSEKYYTQFVHDCAVDDYYDVARPDLNTRYLVHSHCFAAFGSNSDTFFQSVIFHNYKTLYRIIFLLGWFQYSYLQVNLNSLRVDGGAQASKPQVLRRSWRMPSDAIEDIIENTARELTPLLLSEAVLQTQGEPFKKKLRDSLHIDDLSRQLRDEFQNRYDRKHSRENQLVGTAAMYIGILSIINITVTLFLGLINVNEQAANGNLQKLGKTLVQWTTLTWALFAGGLGMVWVVSWHGGWAVLQRNIKIYFLGALSIVLILALWSILSNFK